MGATVEPTTRTGEAPSLEQPLRQPHKKPTETFSIDKHIDKYTLEAHGDNPNPYRHGSHFPEKCQDGTVDRWPPYTVGPWVKTHQSLASPTRVGWMRDLSPVCRELSESIFCTEKQPGIENEREVENESEADDVCVLKSLTLKVCRGNTPPIKIVRAINKHGNEYHNAIYGDGTNSYWYNNRDGSYYKKNRDNSAYFVSSRGFVKYWPAPVLDKPVRHKKRNRGEARDVSTRYPVTSQNAPATRREDIQRPEYVNSTESRIEGEYKPRRQLQPTANRWISPSPSPPPSKSQRPPANKRSKTKQKLKTNRSTKARRTF
ncbi:hypothetical protein BDM02DRAFT_3127001 [Thelephora ganbajun]|uniref:Uncharacterized protein n=1 Tax=Thelephora ganbajun TaxID=370292 RepID=A0ACB6ZPZ2_THEGA|nr:hypothetical protein BDM02DRAFT_3127001 [Thelephora ganbajun]